MLQRRSPKKTGRIDRATVPLEDAEAATVRPPFDNATSCRCRRHPECAQGPHNICVAHQGALAGARADVPCLDGLIPAATVQGATHETLS
jgi:hypothetical protein